MGCRILHGLWLRRCEWLSAASGCVGFSQFELVGEFQGHIVRVRIGGTLVGFDQVLWLATDESTASLPAGTRSGSPLSVLPSPVSVF